MTELSTWYQVYLLVKNELQQVSIFIIIKESVNKAGLSGKHLTLTFYKTFFNYSPGAGETLDREHCHLME